ncbi:MAG: ATP-binding protein [Caldilineaceae bacterium]
MRFYSLRNRFLLLVIVVLAVTGVMTTWLASRAIAQRFQSYVVSSQKTSLDRLEKMKTIVPGMVELMYEEHGGWSEVPSLLQQLSDLSGQRIILFDDKEKMLIDTGANSEGQPSPEEIDGTIIPLRNEGQAIGSLLLTPLVNTQLAHSQSLYITAVNQALLWAVLGTGIFALILTWVLTRGILHPVEDLTGAVQRMTSGDLKQRVTVTSKDEIGDLGHSFNVMADNLARAEQARRHMVSDVAHELRTPLSNIRGYLEAMQDGVVERSCEAINSLHEEALLLNRLVDDLQLLALADSGHLPLVRHPTQVGEVVEKAVQIAGLRVNGSGIQLNAAVERNLPILELDAERIGQVLHNLLNNAFTYTPQRGKITVNAQRHNGAVEVSVLNTGEGIPTEHLPYLFDRFYRADKSRSRATGGSGLGLAIVKQLIEAHGGRVWAESKVGEWAKFTFALPIEGQGMGD